MFHVSKLKGLNIVNSTPSPNQGGKSTLTIDAIMFLLFGVTTKTDKQEEIFNKFTDKNEVLVRGLLELNGEDVIIERKLTRTNGKAGVKTSGKVNYYSILPDGTEKSHNEEQSKETTKLINRTISNQDDFEMLVLATESNLDNLIGLTSAKSTEILNRFIGLEVIINKEAVVRKMHNTFNTTKKGNLYNVPTLQNEIEGHNDSLKFLAETLKVTTESTEKTKDEIKELEAKITNLLESKKPLDVQIATLNPSNIESDIQTITKQGKDISNKIAEVKVRIKDIGDVKYEELTYVNTLNDIGKLNAEISMLTSQISELENNIQQLIDGGICKSCNRKLDDVDNSEHINKHKLTLTSKLADKASTDNNLTIKKELLESMKETKKLFDEKTQLELDICRFEVDLDSLRNKLVEKRNDLNKYNLNLTIIDLNKSIDIDISKIKTDLVVKRTLLEKLIKNISDLGNEVLNNEKEITSKENLIKELIAEDEVDRIFKIYTSIVGKKGISKIVLRSVLPIINSQLQSLLEDVCDFEVEVYIDDKNDVKFLFIKDGIVNNLRSASGLEKTVASLALRAVLGKVSKLPMPNMITFDEVLGKIGNENLYKVEGLFKKIKEMYDVVFLVTHNPLVKEWADNIVTVTKENNISTLSVS
jgi:DNA repair exonuclease SbcCD ATPase subunit